MSREPRHRRKSRTRGFRLFTGRGRRRRTQDPDRVADPEELARQADRVSATRARRRVAGALIGAVLLVAGSVAVTFLVLSEREVPEELGSPEVEGRAYLGIVTGEAGMASSLALIAARSDGPAQVILFPPDLLVTIPGYGDGPIGEVTRFEGAGLAELTVANLLGVRVDGSLVFPPGAIPEAVQEPVPVDLSAELIVPVEGGGEQVVAAPGSAPRDGAALQTLLTVQGTSDQLLWLQRQGDVWEALVRAVGEDPELGRRLAAASSGAVEPAAELLVAAGRAEELVVTAVPASRIAVGGDTEAYQLSGEEAASFVASRLDYLALREEPRTRVEVLNGNGRIGTTRAVAEALIRRGFRVVKTDNADSFDHEVSEVIAQGRENQEPALEVRELLGRGEVILELRRPSGVVDLTIIVGQDIPAEEG